MENKKSVRQNKKQSYTNLELQLNEFKKTEVNTISLFKRTAKIVEETIYQGDNKSEQNTTKYKTKFILFPLLEK